MLTLAMVPLLIAVLLVGGSTGARAQSDTLRSMPPATAALTLRIEQIAATDTALVVDLVTEHLFDPETARGLAEGVPATLIYEIQVWRHRAGWFDQYTDGRLLVFKLQRDAWDEVYVVRDSDGGVISLPDLDQVRAILERQVGIAVAPILALSLDHPYYLVIKVALKPLTAEDVDELEGWLAGEIAPEEHKFGLLTLPKNFFGLVMDLTGVGDRNGIARSETFRRSDLDARRDDS
jgi:hypothetical protein